MPKYYVAVGRLTREHTSLIVEAPDEGAVLENLDRIIQHLEDTDQDWEGDCDFVKYEPKASIDEAEEDAVVDFSIRRKES